jgi:D-alanyl-D-alanine carboxypeptidase
MPIASLTKLMSAIVVLGNIKLSDKIIITKDIEDWQEIKTIKENEIFTADDLLKTSLIESNNSTMIALARSLGEDKFVELMNKKAEDIGLVNTKFYNETGLDLKDKVSNFSTVEDLAKLTKYILYNYPKIFEITKQKEFLLCDIEFNYCRTVKNTNLLLNNDSLKDNVVGGKTGETKIAGGCLILVIKGKIEGEYFISIVLNSKDRFTDTEKIISKYGK